MKQAKIFLLLFITLFVLVFVGCSQETSLNETFDELGRWAVGDDDYAVAGVMDGVYRFNVQADTGSFWTTAGKSFSNGIYEVSVTQTGGTQDIGYGMMFRVDSSLDEFYLFEVSSDGQVWIGRCIGRCTQQEMLIGNWWFETAAINRGLNQTNVLRVNAEFANLSFYINDILIGQVTDETHAEGDIGLYVETLGNGNVQVEFDDFTVDPN